jgi:elongator complex protein 3
LLKKAEEIAVDRNYGKIAVMSGIGVREYYERFGYEREGPFMVKKGTV